MNAAITAFIPRTVGTLSGWCCTLCCLCPISPGCAQPCGSPRQLQPSRSWRNPCFLPARIAWGSFQPLVQRCVGRIGLLESVSVVVALASRLAALFDVWHHRWAQRQGFPPPFHSHPQVSPGSRELFPGRWKGWWQMSTSAWLWCFRSWSSGPCKRRCCGCFGV